MASEIKLPELGENVEGGTIVELYVSSGDEISEGQALLEVEAGKSTVDVPAPASGKITEVLVKKGEEVQTGQVLFKVESTNGATKEKAPPQKAEAKEKPAAEKDGQKEKAAPPKEAAQQPAAQPAEKATAEKKTPAAASAAPTVEAKPQPGAAAEPAAEEEPLSTPTDKPGRLVPASPATRLLARQLGVDISLVKGSAPHGRVTPEDVKGYVRQLASGGGVRAGKALVAPQLPDFSKWGEIEAQPLSGIRQETAKQMALAWSLVPHVTQHDQADITDLEAFRKAQSADGPKITVTPFALKAVAIALQQFPQFNSTLDLAKNQLILKHYFNVGVAVDTERGLLVPVLRDVDKKSIYQLAEELTAIAEKARQRKISAEDISGGTFTITNLGGIGGTGFTPIVNYPEVAILGMSRARLQPVIHNGEVVPRLLLPLSLSYDHRVIDGADAARFTRRLAEMLENPLVMLLHA